MVTGAAAATAKITAAMGTAAPRAPQSGAPCGSARGADSCCAAAIIMIIIIVIIIVIIIIKYIINK